MKGIDAEEKQILDELGLNDVTSADNKISALVRKLSPAHQLSVLDTINALLFSEQVKKESSHSRF